MKDKIKSDKSSGTQEIKPDGQDEVKKEILSDDPHGKNGENKIPNFLDVKNRVEDIKDEDGLLGSKVKAENLTDPSLLFPTDGNENLMMVPGDAANLPPSGNLSGPQGTIAGVQPLPSNVINKQPGTMEAQYMQQQSQIFVFSTQLANKAAEHVLQGQYPSIISFHCAQPGTKKYLEKHPLKLNQFNRQSPAQWLNNLAQFKQKGFVGSAGSPGAGPQPHGLMPPKGPRLMVPGNMPPGPTGPGTGPGGPLHDLEGLPDGPDLGSNREIPPDFPALNIWNQPGGMSNSGMQGSMGPGGPGGPMRDKACLGGRPPPMDQFSGVSQYTLTGTKVPTENLTPQQRQHREEQLATIRKMQQMLFPENHSQPSDEFGNPRMMMPHNPQDGPPCPPNGNMNGPRGPRPNMEGPMGSPMMPANSGMVGSPMMSQAMGMDGSESHGSEQNSLQKMPGGVAAQMEWQKLQQQFYEKKKGGRTGSPIPRGGKMPAGMGMGSGSQMPPQMQPNMSPLHNQGMSLPPQLGGNMQQGNNMQMGMPGMQGPPPPYHQTARSSSVPNAMSSPAPESPGNGNMSLPSPRTSDLNSPSDVSKMVKMVACSPPNNQGSPVCSKMSTSNPDTPVSASQSPTSNKEMFSRGPKVGKSGCKEPNLMPVPSPQQIQYLNTFDAQELTIQKQPNTSLKDPNQSSPLNQSMPETPTCKTPNTNHNSPNQQQGSPRYQTMQQQQQPPHTPLNSVPPNKGDGVTSSPELTACGPGRSPLRQSSAPPVSAAMSTPADNIPLNPNGGSCPPTSKSLQFDPITSLAQMSQQLTSQAPPCQGPPFPPNNMNSMMPMDQGMHMDSMEGLQFGSQQGPPMMDMSGGYMNTPSPKSGMGTPPRCGGPGPGPPFFGGPQFPPRLMGPQSYNGMNVQVKASTPNTIQYLPARPNGPNNTMPAMGGSRNPPSLDFLQRFANPPLGGNCHPDPSLMMGGQMMRGQIRPGMKPSGPPSMGKPGPVFDPMGMGPQGMFKGSPLGMGPDASQPLPPTMGQGNNFKNSPFVSGPTVADPNYAQQFHNFQQQLYATNTRSQLNSHLNQSYFMPK